MELLDPCKYSFEDLFRAAGKDVTTEELVVFYRLPQAKRNFQVKILCELADWYYEDVLYRNGVTYTAFSPDIKKVK